MQLPGESLFPPPSPSLSNLQVSRSQTTGRHTFPGFSVTEACVRFRGGLGGFSRQGFNVVKFSCFPFFFGNNSQKGQKKGCLLEHLGFLEEQFSNKRRKKGCLLKKVVVGPSQGKGGKGPFKHGDFGYPC